MQVLSMQVPSSIIAFEFGSSKVRELEGTRWQRQASSALPTAARSSSLRCALARPRLPPLLSSTPPPLLSSYAAGWQRRRLVRAGNNKPCSTNNCLKLRIRCKPSLKASRLSRQAVSLRYQPPISCTLRDQSPLKHTPWPSAPSSASYQPPSPPAFTHTHTPLEHLIRKS